MVCCRLGRSRFQRHITGLRFLNFSISLKKELTGFGIDSWNRAFVSNQHNLFCAFSSRRLRVGIAKSATSFFCGLGNIACL